MTFIVSSPYSSPSSNSLSSGISASQFATGIGTYALNRYGPTLLNAAQQRADTFVNNLASKVANGGNSSNSNSNSNSANGNGNAGSSSNSGNDSQPPGGRRASRSARGASKLGPGGVLDRTGVPKFTIDSGISSGTIVNPLQKTTKYYSPLYCQCGSFFPQNDVQKISDLHSLMNNELFYKYQIIVLAEVNYSLGRNFTVDKFYEYVYTISNALQLYYMVDSILSFTGHTPNNNIAMTRLSMRITPEIANGHMKLKEILQSTPIPPKLLEYIRFMYQNYTFNDVTGSSIIRLSLESSLCTSEFNDSLGISGSTYVKLLDRLIDLSDVGSILKKIRSNWVVTMPPSTYDALYNPQFSTFWHNSCISYEDYGSKTVKFSIESSSPEELLYYGIFDNRLDGLIYASSSVSDKNNVVQKGLWKPFSDYSNTTSLNSSLIHYSNDNLVRPVTEVEFRNASMVFAAPHTVITDSKNPVWILNKSNFAGSCIPQVHSLENMTQALVQSVNWLLKP